MDPISYVTAGIELLGGLGLFLIGMVMLTDGLKLAAGAALESLLANWTSSRRRAFASGFALTAVVQSSSAVTVAAIGFVNAGILTLANSLWVVFGSNVGTTMTAWIVALVGLRLKVEVLALPLIGIGALVQLLSSGAPMRARGQALAGFGLLFLGLRTMQGAFAGIESGIDLSTLVTGGITTALAMLLIGLVLTALMQSSSASMALILTAVDSGVLPPMAGAAGVIGANVGTTVTALLASVGATSNARRVALAHVLFNLQTAVVALILLVPFVSGLLWLQGRLGLTGGGATLLALFHTTFNLLGVALMIPTEPALTRLLGRLFRRREEELARPIYLDRNIAAIGELASQAMTRELLRLAEAIAPAATAREQQHALVQLRAAIDDFISDASRQELTAEVADVLQHGFQASYHLGNCLDYLHVLPALQTLAAHWPERHRIAVTGLCDRARQLLAVNVKIDMEGFENAYVRLRDELMNGGRTGTLPLRQLEDALRDLNGLRRLVREFDKARRLLATTTAGRPADPDELATDEMPTSESSAQTTPDPPPG